MGIKLSTSSIVVDPEFGWIVATLATTGRRSDELIIYGPDGELYFQSEINSIIDAIKPYREAPNDIRYSIYGVAIHGNLIFIPNRILHIVYVFTFNADLVSSFGIGQDILFGVNVEGKLKSTRRLGVDDDGIFVCCDNFVLALIHDIKPKYFEIVKEESTTKDIILHQNNLHILSSEEAIPTITVLSKHGVCLHRYRYHEALGELVSFTLDGKGRYYLCTPNSVLIWDGRKVHETDSNLLLILDRGIALDDSRQRLVFFDTSPELGVKFLSISRFCHALRSYVCSETNAAVLLNARLSQTLLP